MALKTAVLVRQLWDSRQTLGSIATQHDGEIFVAKTLELPWLGNKNDVSCIPSGQYLCRWSRSHRLSLAAGHDVYTYEVMDVPQRSGIRIHSANFFYQLKGCIAMGNAFKDINRDSELDVIHSGNTVAEFNEIMNKEDFSLIIRSI